MSNIYEVERKLRILFQNERERKESWLNLKLSVYLFEFNLFEFELLLLACFSSESLCHSLTLSIVRISHANQQGCLVFNDKLISLSF